MKYLCVFGNPISHSLSPLIHNYALCSLNLPFVYGRFCLQNGENLKEKFYSLNLSGANVTIPFKEDAFKQADELDSLAQKIGAVNTLVKIKNGKLKGYNTDASGFVASLTNTMLDIRHKILNPTPFANALVLGAGGSAKALACILDEIGLDVLVANRSDLKRGFYDLQKIRYCNFSELEAMLKSSTKSSIPPHFDLVINATSASLQGNLPLQKDILQQIFSRAKLAYDLMYGENLTPFLALAKKCNLTYKDGKDMLLWQAAEALAIFISQDFANNDLRNEAKKNVQVDFAIRGDFANNIATDAKGDKNKTITHIYSLMLQAIRDKH
ncbi:shikimate dehydrogenase [Helicobacter sp. T3_23-1059]